MKRRIFSILFALVLACSLGLVMAVPAAADPVYAGYTLGAIADDTAEWSTDQKVSGDYSAKLTHTADATKRAYVKFTPPTGITLAEFVAAPTTYGFFYWRTEDKIGPQLELTFTDGNDGRVELTAEVALYDYLTDDLTEQWIEKTLSAGEHCTWFGAAPDGDPIAQTGLPEVNELGDLITLIEAHGNMDGYTCGAWEMTQVIVDLGWSNDTQTAYIDDVTIDGTTYDLEPEAPTVTLVIPENVYRPAPVDVSSTTTNPEDGAVYSNVRFDITVSGPESFVGYDRVDVFTITAVVPGGLQGINETFVLVDGNFVGYWGPVGGFTLPASYSATSVFTIQMNDETTAPLGDYEVTVALVDLTPDPDETLATATDGFNLSLDPRIVNVDKETVHNSIQDAIDAADPGDNITVAAGTYEEQLTIDKSLTVIGAGAETTTIKAPASMTTVNVRGQQQAIQGVVNVIGVEPIPVNISGFTVDGNYEAPVSSSTWFAGIVYSNAEGTIEDNIITKVQQEPIDPVDGASFRGHGIWVGDTSTVTVDNNSISEFQRNGIEVRDAAATATVTNNIITGMDTSPSVCNGITFYYATGGMVSSNTVTGCIYTGPGSGNDFYDGTQACGIMSWDGSGTFTADNNTVRDNDMGIYSRLVEGGKGVITNNTVENNLYFGIVFRKGDVEATGNSISGGEIGILIPSTHTSSVLTANFNNIAGNTVYGIKDDKESGVDAECNWWGDISGPQHETIWEVGYPITNPGGIGNAVSDYVEYIPWLTRDFDTVLADNIAYFGFPMVWLNAGWNTLSTPIALDPACATWGSYVDLGDGLALYEDPEEDEWVNAYWFDGDDQVFGQVSDGYPLKPCDAIYVQMAEPDIAAILWSPDVSVASKDLYAGWNLVSFARWPEGPEDCCRPAQFVLQTVEWVTGDLHGYKLVVNPPVNWSTGYGWPHFWRGEGDGPRMMCVTLGYWVFMNNDGTLAGLSSTPIPLD